MRIGLVVSGSHGITFEDWSKTIATAERLEFPTLFVSDHFMVGEPQDSLEPYLMFATAAMQSSTLRLGPLVTPITFRAPWNLARWGAQLDILSGGRFVMGLGVGWHEPEHTAFGIPYPSLRERFDRLEEALEVMKLMWTSDSATFEGRYYQLRDAQSLPKPWSGRPPIMIGGGGEKRTLKIVAKYADEWNSGNLSPEELRRKLEVLGGHCDAVGRDPSSISTSMLAFGLIGPTDKEIDEATRTLKEALAPELDVSLPVYREQLKAAGTIVGGAEQVVDQLGKLAEAGMEEVIFNNPDPASETLPEFIAAEIAPKVAAL
ncbi:MAG TPA: TIGR03560 family F420-dependent LLM class oxidoreductase [Dehalococcoidia bacterium]|nr:TIGR03560 family F420-dependent LLM class oxidoreductase [Dehalococcoidia bacterium]